MQCRVVRSVDENVNQLDGDVALVNEFAEKVIHHGLEGCGGICEAKKHDHWLKEASIRLERSLSLVAIAHANVVVAPTDIQLCKEHRPAAMHSRKSIHKFSNERERGGIANSEGVQSAVVLDRLEVTVLLFDKEKGKCVGGFRLADVPFFKIFCNKLLQHDIFGQG